MEILGLPIADYHARPELGATDLRNILKSPAHFRAARAAPREQTDALKVGSAIHAKLDGTFDGAYIARPEGLDLRTKEGKQWKAELNPKYTVLSADEMASVLGMHEAIKACPDAQDCMRDAVHEMSVIRDGLKCRPDIWTQSIGMIVDLKKTRDISPDSFSRSIVSYGYDVQAAHYLAVMPQAGYFVFLCAEDDPPFDVRMYVAGSDVIERGRRKREMALRMHALCAKYDKWPTSAIWSMHEDAWELGVSEWPSRTMCEINLPAWAKRENGDD